MQTMIRVQRYSEYSSNHMNYVPMEFLEPVVTSYGRSVFVKVNIDS